MIYQNDIFVQKTPSLSEISQAGWDSLPGEFDLYLSTSWLSVEEQISSIAPVYLLGKLEDRLVAGLATYILGPDVPAWPFARIDAFILRLLEEAGHRASEADTQLLRQTLPTLLCGSRRSGLSRLPLLSTLAPAVKEAVMKETLHNLTHYGQEKGAGSVSFLYVDEDDLLLRNTLLQEGYLEFPSSVACRMRVAPDFATYLARFHAHRRSIIKKEYQTIKDANIEFCVRPLTEEVIQQILPLEIALYEKYQSEFPPEEALRLHRAVAQQLGDRVQVLIATHDQQICGFVVFVRWHDTLYARQGGFDYAFQGKLPLYFGLVFYAATEYAATVNARYIEYGVGSEQAKGLRGCDLRRQYAYIKVFDEDLRHKLSLLLPQCTK